MLAAYTIVVVVALLAPFRFHPRNGAEWLEHGDGIRFPSTGVVRTDARPTRLHADLTTGTGLTVELLLTAQTRSSSDHARILSYSRSPDDRNFTLDQKRGSLIVMLRTSHTGRRGSSELAVDDVFAGVRRHVVVTYDLRLLCVYVEGRRRTCSGTPGGDLSTWDPSYALVLGNELTGDRPWLGSIFRVALYNAPLSSEAVARAYAAALSTAGAGEPGRSDDLVALYPFGERSGSTVADRSGRVPVPLTIPPLVGTVRPFLSRQGQLLSAPLTAYTVFDAIINLVIFVPVGILACAVLDRRGWTPVTAAIASITGTALLSVVVETMQYFIVSRSSELQDVALNVASGALGVAVYWLARRRRRRRVSTR